jgi:hypothetical protein
MSPNETIETITISDPSPETIAKILVDSKSDSNSIVNSNSIDGESDSNKSVDVQNDSNENDTDKGSVGEDVEVGTTSVPEIVSMDVIDGGTSGNISVPEVQLDNTQNSEASIRVDRVLQDLEDVIDAIVIDRREKGKGSPYAQNDQKETNILRPIWEKFGTYTGSTQYDLITYVKRESKGAKLPQGLNYRSIVNNPDFLMTIPKENRQMRKSARKH